MKTPLIALCLLAFSLPLGCGTDEETPPDPLATRTGFCKEWGKNACNDDVVDACQSPDKDACAETQADFCLEILPENYDVKRARECLAAVKAAYKDAKLSADDIAVVLKLGAPCDQLSAGTEDEGDACTKSDDCNTAADQTCVIKGSDTEGTCQKPTEVGPGESCRGAGDVCPEGFFCDSRNCLAYRDTGDECTGDFECQPSDHCVADATDATIMTCEARLARSKECTVEADCQSRYCAIAKGETTGKCADTIILSVSELLCESLQ
jgi:hypothetical protein